MPEGYHHLTYEERCQIYALMQSGLSQAAIARRLGVSSLHSNQARLGLQHRRQEAIASNGRRRRRL